MNDAEINVVWLSSTIFFGLFQVVSVIMASMLPQATDDAIESLEWISGPLTFLTDLSYVALLFAVVMTWIYILSNDRSAVGFSISIIISILSGATYYWTRRLISSMVISRFREAAR